MIILNKRDLIKSRREFGQVFYKSFDPSWVRTCLEGRKQGQSFDLVGEGTYFQCFRLKGQPGVEFDIALLLSKPSFCRQARGMFAPWYRAMKLLSRLEHPLLPPLEVFESADQPAYILPYCEGSLAQDIEKSPEFQQLRVELEHTLDAAGLVLDDHWQFRTLQKHPFLIDFSDLAISPKG